MLNRGLGILAVVCMVAVNAALFVRDVLPAWVAGDPPPPGASSLRPGFTRVGQIGIFGADNQRLGTIWTKARRNRELLYVDSTMTLEMLKTAGETLTPRLRIDTSYIYRSDYRLEKLGVDVEGFGLPIRLDGQFAPPNEFVCEWQADERKGRFVLPSDATRAIGDVTRPFESLADLEVGQTWRLELFDPLAAILPGWQGSDMSTQAVIVRVTRTEMIEHNGLGVKVFVVEADRMRAWVSPIGRVLRQEVTLPFFGTIILVDEPYDDEARSAVSGAFADPG